MTTLDQMLTDPFFWAAVATWVVLYTFVKSDINDGYDPLTDANSLREWEELHIVLLSIPEAIILSWVINLTGVSGIFLNDKITLPIVGEIALVGVTNFTVIFGLLLVLRWGVPWIRTIQKVDTTKTSGVLRSSGIYVATLFGLGLGIAVHVATHPSATTLEALYQIHLNLAIEVLRQFQAILGLQVGVVAQLTAHMVAIYKNNALLALKAGVFGAIGGLGYGLGIPLLLIMGVNAAMVWGVFTGLLIRNSILAGQGLFAAPIAYLSSMGLLIVGQTFHEFMAILLVGVGAGFITLGFVKSRFDTSKAGFYAAGFGLIVQLGFAAFVEVWIDPRFINALKGVITVEPRIASLGFNTDWALATGSVLVTTLAFAVVVAWMIRVTIRTVETEL